MGAGHFSEVARAVKFGESSDSFAKHMKTHFEHNTKVKPKDIRKILRMEIYWKGDPLVVNRTFSTRNCLLCDKERCAIMDANFDPTVNLINSNHEMFGVCRHNVRFHRFLSTTDDRE